MNLTLFSPHIGQRKIIDGFADSKHKFGVVSTGRQFGKSLLAQNLMLYWLLKTPNQKGAWITPVYNQCKKVFQELTNAANTIIKSQNKADLTITFINGSTLQFLSTDNYNTIRGFSFSHMVIDEAAFIKEAAINEAVLPTLTALGKKCLVISTPRSKNWFFHYYIKGSTSNDNYISFRGISSDNPYVSKDFLDDQLKSLPQDIYNQEYLAEFTDAGSDVFTGVSNVCILKHYNGPQRTEKYYIGVDTGIQNDYSVLTIISEGGRVGNIIRINGRTFAEIGDTFVHECSKWNVVGGYIETNGIGLAMSELMRPRIKKLQTFTTTNDTKTTGIRKLIYDIQQGNLELPSKDLFPHLYNELTSYTYKISANGNMTFSAPSGLNDDCVMSLMLANQARHAMFSPSKLYIGNKNKQQIYN